MSTPAPRAPAGLARDPVWRLAAPLFTILLAFALLNAGLRLARPRTVFYYTEGAVLGSLAALEDGGDLTSLYPADGWTEPPTVLTLYPPAYFVLATAVDAAFSSEGTLLGLRLVSLAALALVLTLLWRLALRRGVPIHWMLAVTAAALMTPAVYTVIGGAQADSLALLWTWVGLVAAADPDARPRRLVVAGVAFALAFYSKQSFVAAPAALTLGLVLAGRRRGGLAFGVGFAGTALLGTLLLDRVTNGGYVANTIGALTGAAGSSNLASTLSASEPTQWIPLALVAILALRGNLRWGFPELYLTGSTLLHVTAMLKTGSSVNYLLEPTFALLWLVPMRYSKTPAALTGRPAPRPVRRLFVILLAGALALTATLAAVRERGITWAMLALKGPVRIAAFDGRPLTDPYFFPAVLERGARPWLSDPFAFGVLEETGRWDPARLVADLEALRVPFVLTMVDLRSGPAPPERGSRDLVMAYFWRSPELWTAVTGHYELIGPGPVFVWLPREARP